MKMPADRKKWASVALGLVSVALLVNLAVRIRTTRATDSRPPQPVASAPRPKSARVPVSVADDLARYDPVLHLEALKAAEARSLPSADRNLFDFITPPAPKVTPAQQAAAQAAAAPPPPPPIPLKPAGYNEMPGGAKQVIVTTGDRPEDPTLIVHEGDVLLSRYKVLKITPTTLTVEDDTAHRTADLPIPQ